MRVGVLYDLQLPLQIHLRIVPEVEQVMVVVDQGDHHAQRPLTQKEASLLLDAGHRLAEHFLCLEGRND